MDYPSRWPLPMASWAEIAAEAPGLADEAAERFRHHQHCLVATLRHDGSPRLSGIEVWWWNGDVWLGMMPDSAKGADLDRDPRFELHSTPTDLELQQPDARLWGTAERIHDEETINAFAAGLPEPGPPPHEMSLYRLDLTGASLVRVAGNELVMDVWMPGGPARRSTRR